MNARLLFPILAIVMGLSACSKKTVRQISSSMEPTIKKGEYVTMDQGSYRSSLPARWDVVTFEPPQHPDQMWAFRIVGLPGETIDITPTGVSIDGKIISRPSSLSRLGPYQRPSGTFVPGTPMTAFPYTIPADSYFVLGDNVSNAMDSRYWGALKKSQIHGKVWGK